MDGRYREGESRLIEELRTPRAVQRWLRSMPYNDEDDGETLRSFRGVVRHGRAHCIEGALAAAAILERHGHRPRLLDLESVDGLDHVAFAFRGPDLRWGAVGKSGTPGLHGRRPVFGDLRSLVMSYYDPYVDEHGRIRSWGLLDLSGLPSRVRWRTAPGNVWAVERALWEMPHEPVRVPASRWRRLRARYVAFDREHPDREPDYYRNVETWW
ncbi:MAG: hypothetical protein ACT4PT_13505 [Methanobacteriota archaeon]